MGIIYNIMQNINSFLWSYLIIISLLFIGIYFSIKLNFIQIRFLKHAFSILFNKQAKSQNHISSLSALYTSLASLIGVGSIAGMSIAISSGGPGTIFWVWIISLLGMATNLVEHTLGQIYKEKTNLNLFMGGPSYYIKKGLNAPILAKTFSVILIISYGFAFNSVQANTITSSIFHSFHFQPVYIGLTIAFFTALVIFGGIKNISTYSSYLVPIMGIVYLGLATLTIILHIEKLPAIFTLIIKSAFGFEQAIYGGASYLFLKTAIIGTKRAMFSTEAGMGSTPNISASAQVNHPTTQGLIGMIGVFLVGFVICTATALIILSSDVYGTSNTIQGVELVQSSLKSSLGEFSVYLLVFCVITFGFTSIIGNYAYAENNMNFLHKNKLYIYALRFLVVIMVYYGSVVSMQYVWDFADLVMGLMILVNLYALFRLRNVAINTTEDYIKQLKENKSPKFTKQNIAELKEDNNNVW
jgi:AGCS family alanine or glycine:cation symporter